MQSKINVKTAFFVITLLGFVSLFADITYEGARGIVGPFLFTLGASATVVGFVGGLGELVGYGLRFVSGYVVDKTKRYWIITGAGYFINLVAVPLLAFAGNLEIASALIIAERFGKAIRTPARDTILSYASSNIGYGKGFGLHEALDQIGAIIGPLIVAGAIYKTQSYSNAFLLLGIPAALSLLTLFITMTIFPKPETLEFKTTNLSDDRLGQTFYLYLLFSALTISGYPHFQIISYHLKKTQIVSDEIIPALFALAMGIDALTALVIGGVFDKFKIKTLFFIPVFSIPISFLSFAMNDPFTVVVAIVLWGIVMGFQETAMKSALAELVPPEKRGSAFGMFHGLFGFSWFVGSFIFGKLYDISILYLVIFSVGLQILSLFVFLYLRRKVIL
ncbi:MAG: MFS transporter [Candidatus Kryptonium sp.]|nr:MFS transporter [Candidatus Kryptonium sp.]